MIRTIIQFRAGENQAPIEAYVHENWRKAGTGPMLGMVGVWYQAHGEGFDDTPDQWINVETIASIKPL